MTWEEWEWHTVIYYPISFWIVQCNTICGILSIVSPAIFSLDFYKMTLPVEHCLTSFTKLEALREPLFGNQMRWTVKEKWEEKRAGRFYLSLWKKTLFTFLMKIIKLYLLLMYLLGMCHFRDKVIIILNSHLFSGYQLGEYKQAFLSGKTEDAVTFWACFVEVLYSLCFLVASKNIYMWKASLGDIVGSWLLNYPFAVGSHSAPYLTGKIQMPSVFVSTLVVSTVSKLLVFSCRKLPLMQRAHKAAEPLVKLDLIQLMVSVGKTLWN